MISFIFRITLLKTFKWTCSFWQFRWKYYSSVWLPSMQQENFVFSFHLNLKQTSGFTQLNFSTVHVFKLTLIYVNKCYGSHFQNIVLEFQAYFTVFSTFNAYKTISSLITQELQHQSLCFAIHILNTIVFQFE